MSAQRSCKEEGSDYADEVFDQIWCGYQKKASDKRRLRQQAYLQDAKKMTKKQTEDSQKKRERLFVFSHSIGTAVMTKESATG